MNKALTTILFVFCSLLSFAADNGQIQLSGRVYDAVTKSHLTKSKVYLYNSQGEICDSVTANQGFRWKGDNETDTLAYFSLSVPKVDSTYVYEVVCPGYKTMTLTYKLDKIGKREAYREIPPILMQRAPRQLNEVTVTATKIKFYNKGDTLVYNADAFQLAEGSMLDELIAQLPGAELNTDGQIKINGEFVESLLLNGKQFFDGNNNLMLENIAAYTVKDINVYKGQTIETKEKGDINAPKVLTMDVRLKKEYNLGWMLNAQGGYGTDDRYIGKIFANMFTSTLQLTALANFNNLNDNRKPGRNDTWTPDQQPRGTLEYRMAGINYDYRNEIKRRSARGNFTFAQSIDDSRNTTYRTNFLSSGNTYENSYSKNRNKETSLNLNNGLNLVFKEILSLGVSVYGQYKDVKNSNSSLSGTFNDEPTGINAEILDAIYSDGSEEQLEKILNRSRTRADGKRKKLEGNVGLYSIIRIPKSDDNIGIYLDGNYISDKNYKWSDFDINFGSDPTAVDKRRHYTAETPNYIKNLNAQLAYRFRIKGFSASINYAYRYSEQKKNSNMYALERLEDMGVFGVVPDGYLSAFDPANSYRSHRFENTHIINPEAQYSKMFENSSIWAMFRGTIGFKHRNFYYWRNNQPYTLSTSNTYFALYSSYDCLLEYDFNKSKEAKSPRGHNYRNSLHYNYTLTPEMPNLFDMVDIVDDANPLSIFYGNPDLKMSKRHEHRVFWNYKPESYTFNNRVSLSYSYTDGALTQGYSYETSTGIRHYKMYNIDGINSFRASDNMAWQFGKKKQFSITSESSYRLSHYVNLIGIDRELPQQYKLTNRTISQNLRFTWQIGKQGLTLRGDYTNRHATSEQDDFNPLNVNHFNYGISGNFKLPAGFGINTDFTCYTRRGYGSPELDTTDPVWNVRLSYAPPRNRHWVIMLDGFDMLHKISNVNYAVNANGRVVSYTNALPHYFMLTAQYRLSIQPKKK